MNRNWIRTGAVACLCLAGLLTASISATADEAQLREFTVRTKSGQKIFTVLVDTGSKRKSQVVCSFGPRLRDTILGDLSRRPPKLTAAGDINLAALKAQLLPIIRSQLPANTVDDVRVIKGAQKVSTNAAKSLSQLGCTVSEQ